MHIDTRGTQAPLSASRDSENMKLAVSARRSVLLSSGVDLAVMFAQSDPHRVGFVPRTAFAAVLRDCGVPIADTTLHFLVILLSLPTDTAMVSYVRFLDMTGGDAGTSSWAATARSHSAPHSWQESR